MRVVNDVHLDLGGLTDPPVLTEGEVLTGDWLARVREAVGQLYEYRYFCSSAVVLFAVLSAVVAGLRSHLLRVGAPPPAVLFPLRPALVREDQPRETTGSGDCGPDIAGRHEPTRPPRDMPGAAPATRLIVADFVTAACQI